MIASLGGSHVDSSDPDSAIPQMLDRNQGAISDDNQQPPSAGTGRPPKPVKHQWFDQWLIARGEPLKTLVAEIEQIIEHREQRKRSRKAEDQANYRRMVEGTVCNLAYAVLKPPLPTGRLAVNTRNEAKGKTRYDNRAFGKPYPAALALLASEGLLKRKISDIRGENSSIAPTFAFADRVRASGITFADFAADPVQEVIRLTRVNRTKAEEPPYRTQKHKELIEYADVAISNEYRAEVQALNAFLHQSDIAFIDDGLEPRVDPYRRTLTRRFTIFDTEETRFDQVGRLFGGFWMSMKKERRQHIRINGEPVADLDYSSMFTRLAYAHLRLTPPPGDLYAIPGLEGHRDGIKLAMNCFLFDETPNRKKWPADMNRTYETYADPTDDDEAVAEKLPTEWTVSKTKKAILSVHPGLDRAWGRGLGYRLMWQESEILLMVLSDLLQQGISALGLHDGLLVPVSKTEIALQAMRTASKAVVGVELRCTVKG
jgi:hypothetical protein